MLRAARRMGRRKSEAEDGERKKRGRAQMSMEEARICQTAGSLRNSALTFTGQAATTDENLCTLSLCIIGLEQPQCVYVSVCVQVCVHMAMHAWKLGHMCVCKTETFCVSEHMSKRECANACVGTCQPQRE